MNKKLTIQAMQQIAESRGGKCVSDTYVDNKTKLTWQCAKGHQWMATPSISSKAHGAPIVRGTAKTIQDMRRLAEPRGGDACPCLCQFSHSPALAMRGGSPVEGNSRQHPARAVVPFVPGTAIDNPRHAVWRRARREVSLRHLCQRTTLSCGNVSEGHHWKATPANVKTGNGAPYAMERANRRWTIYSVSPRNEVAGVSRTPTSTTTTHLTWECIEGHRWKATWGNISEGHGARHARLD